MKNLKVGFIGFGEVNTPREMIERKVAAAKQLLIDKGLEIVDGGVVTDDPDRLESAAATARLTGQELDAIVLCVAGWIPTYAAIRTVDPFKHLPMVLWGLCGSYEGGGLVTTAEQAGTSGLRKPLEDLGFTFRYVYDTTDGICGVDGLMEYLETVSVTKSLMTAKVAMMGYRDMNLYGTMFDGVLLKKKTGIEIEFIEMLEMVQHENDASEEELRYYLDKIKREWSFVKPASDEVLIQGIKYFLALKTIVERRGYQGVSLIDVDGMKKLLGFPPSMVFMLLANELGVCTVPENDSLGSATQLLAKALTGQIAVYLEFYEYMKDRVLMGVPDFVPQEVVDGPYTVMPTSFGLLDSCILNVSKLKTGTATLCRLFPTKGGYGLHMALVEAVAPRSWEEAGWTPPAPQLPSLELVMGDRTRAFTEQVMCQHYILTYGDNRELFRNYCRFNGIEVLEA